MVENEVEDEGDGAGGGVAVEVEDDEEDDDEDDDEVDDEDDGCGGVLCRIAGFNKFLFKLTPGRIFLIKGVSDVEVVNPGGGRLVDPT